MLIRVILREQIGHPVHAPAPGRLELVEHPPRPADGLAVGVHELLASARSLVTSPARSSTATCFCTAAKLIG